MGGWLLFGRIDDTVGEVWLRLCQHLNGGHDLQLNMLKLDPSSPKMALKIFKMGSAASVCCSTRFYSLHRPVRLVDPSKQRMDSVRLVRLQAKVARPGEG